MAFALHGLVDVSGHRAGAAWPALFLLSVAMNPRRPGEPRAWVAPVFRLFGGLLAALAVWWLASDRWAWGPPTTRTLARLDGRLQKAKLNPQRESDSPKKGGSPICYLLPNEACLGTNSTT